MKFFRRRLPHVDIPGAPVFLTWRLFGSLPAGRAFHREYLSSGKVFVTWDSVLDTARNGPLYLRQPEVATIVNDQLANAQTNGICAVHAHVIMPNHVHLLCTPQSSLSEVVRRVKGPTAYEANKILGRSGKFWQDEYFDRLVRNPAEFARIKRYIEWNPVKAGLASSPEEFPWSSATEGGWLEPAQGLSPASD